MTTISAQQNHADNIIIGAGWAGLAAAVELAHQDQSVTVLESAKQAGGRARTVQAMHHALDNGQHIMLGAYRNLFALLDRIGVSETEVLQRLPLTLQSLSTHQPTQGFTLRTPRLPAPLHLLWALLTAKGLAWREKWAAVRLWQALASRQFRLPRDITLAALLQQHHQPPGLVQKLWEPLCVAALNTPLHKASAQVFVTVLEKSFNGNRSDSDLLLPITDLGSVFPQHAIDFLQQKNCRLFDRTRVTELLIEDNRITGVRCDDREFFASSVIMATSPSDTLRLIQEHPSLDVLATQLAAFTFEPIYTLYLEYPETVRLPSPMLGILDGTCQWVFDRAPCGQEGILAAVISASGEHEDMDEASLTATIQDEISILVPGIPAPRSSLLIREKRATFSCTPEINRLRPENRTPVHGLWLAGDYTRTDLPATLEGAMQSGVQCAQLILSSD